MIKMVDVIFQEDEEEYIDQSEKVKKETGKRLAEMGFLFDKTHEKLGKDKTCYNCKKEIKNGEELKLTNCSGTDKGLSCFVSLCLDCAKKYEEDKVEKSKKNK